MSDIDIRIVGSAGRITLTRTGALNALSHDMARKIETALDDWRDQDQVALIVIDAEGDKVFCAGGDIHQIYDAGRAGDYAYGRQFWRDEYRMNLKLAEYPKPVISMMQGFVMGGGVGVGCHASHRIVCETTHMSMPEAAIGLVPDVGGSWLLARAPGFIGEYLGTTSARMGPGDSIIAGFADYYVPRDRWEDLTAKLEAGQLTALAGLAEVPPQASLMADRGWIDVAFDAPNMAGVIAKLEEMQFDAARETLEALRRNSPLAMASTMTMLRSLRAGGGVAHALAQEFRFSYRSMVLGDLLEGIRAMIIDKDHKPVWRHSGPADVTPTEVSEMLAPLGDDELMLEKEAA